MCGIFGLFDLSSPQPPEEDLLEKCTDLMAHRGPDGRGIWREAGIGLGHRRLAVIDLDSGAQPMESADRRLVIVYNGEIYNYRELRAELESQGVRFCTQSDTEVALAAWARWETQAFSKFRGMFALAVWDRVGRRLTLARDRLGVKPLLVAYNGATFAFASEFAPLLELPWVDRNPDPVGLAGYLAHYQIGLGERTMFQGIRHLPAGTWMTVDARGVKTGRYWRLPPVPSAEKRAAWGIGRLDAAAEELAEHLRDAIRSHLVADVPLGAFFSGGVDSAVVVSLMAELTGNRVRAYSVGFDDEEYNEFRYALPMARQLGLDCKLVRFDGQDYLSKMTELITHKRVPLSTPNEVPLRTLAARIGRDLKVALSGEGSDELLGGYTNLLASAADFENARRLRESPQDFAPDQRRALRDRLRRKYGRAGFQDLADHFIAAYSWLSRDDLREILSPQLASPEVYAELDQYWRDRLALLEGLDPADQYLYILETEHLRGLLNRLDADTMAASVESRVPFCDHILVEYAWRLPLEYKFSWGESASDGTTEFAGQSKIVLRRAMAGRIPQSIIERPKKSFPVPLRDILTEAQLESFIARIGSAKHLESWFRLDRLPDWLRGAYRDDPSGIKVWMVINAVTWLEALDAR